PARRDPSSPSRRRRGRSPACARLRGRCARSGSSRRGASACNCVGLTAGGFWKSGERLSALAAERLSWLGPCAARGTARLEPCAAVDAEFSACAILVLAGRAEHLAPSLEGSP